MMLIVEALAFWVIFLGMFVAGFILVVALAFIMVTIDVKRQSKERNNRYYNRY